MKVTIETEDKMELMRIQKSLDMACFIFQLTMNARKKIECEWDKNQLKDPIDIFFEHVNKLLDKYNINIDELLD